MPLTNQLPPSPLSTFVSRLWVTHEDASRGTDRREHVLPTGHAHIVFRLSHPLRVFDDSSDDRGRYVGRALVGGVRSGYYIRDISTPSRSVGALLRPGAVARLFGVPAHELAHCHTPLGDLWGRAADAELDRLGECNDPQSQLDLLCRFLSERLKEPSPVHAMIAWALNFLAAGASVESVVQKCGHSHRHFIALFRRTVGLSPKEYARVARFRKVLRRILSPQPISLAHVALESGFSDQAHFNREFRRFTGVTPTYYLAHRPDRPSHLERTA